ncbi:MAG: type I-B CRISPR-associated endonuclease Cas1b [Candidatus Anstonellaceae archaeon]
MKVSNENYYINENGILKMEKTTLFFINKEKKVEIPIEKIRNVYFIGSGSCSNKVLKEFQKRKILLHYFGVNGEYIGTFYPKEHYISGEMLIRQVKNCMDEKERIKLAKLFVLGAMENMKWICNRFQLGDITLPDLEQINQIPQLMQQEGLIRKIFYSLIDRSLPEDFKIDKREYNPPSNRGNALLSFLNSLTYSAILSEIYHTHLHPAISFLHEPFERRFSLVLDISEIFKPIISERIILKFAHLKMLDPIIDFEDQKGVFLSKVGRKKMLQAFDEEINKTIKTRNTNRKVSLRNLIRIELYKLEKHFLNIKEYKPLKCWW